MALTFEQGKALAHTACGGFISTEQMLKQNITTTDFYGNEWDLQPVKGGFVLIGKSSRAHAELSESRVNYFINKCGLSQRQALRLNILAVKDKVLLAPLVREILDNPHMIKAIYKVRETPHAMADWIKPVFGDTHPVCSLRMSALVNLVEIVDNLC